jgi:hypothetical protein
MPKFALLGVVAILSTAIGTPSPAEAAIELSAYVSSHQDGTLGVASTSAQRREITVVGGGMVDVTASAPSIPSSKRGLEGRQIAAPPWSAACMNDQGPRECGEPMWIYGSRSEVAGYRNAF